VCIGPSTTPETVRSTPFLPLQRSTTSLRNPWAWTPSLRDESFTRPVHASEEKLSGTRKGCSTFQTTSRAEGPHTRVDRLVQIPFIQRDHDPIPFPPKGTRCFDEAPMGIEPPSLVDERMLDHHGTLLCRERTEETERFFWTPFVTVCILLPEPKQPFDVPAQPQHDQNLCRRCASAGNSGKNDRPLCQCESFFTWDIAMLLRCSADTFFALFCHVIRYVHQNQANWETVFLSEDDSSFTSLSTLCWEKTCTLQAVPAARRDIRL